MGRRKRLPHIWTGESACPTFVSSRFAGRRPIRDKAEALTLRGGERPGSTNATTRPRRDLARQRTIDWFNKYVRG